MDIRLLMVLLGKVTLAILKPVDPLTICSSDALQADHELSVFRACQPLSRNYS